MEKEKVVFAVAVKSKHIFADTIQWARNVLGKNLPAYEELLEETIQQALDKLYDKYPDVYDIQITQCEITQGAAEIIVYGKIKVKRK